MKSAGSISTREYFDQHVFWRNYRIRTGRHILCGRTADPAMIEDGYTPEESVAVTASSSCIGPIIPPSILMVVYGASMSVSIAALFMGGLIPEFWLELP